MNYQGIIIEESLKDTSVLKAMNVTSTKVESVTEKHKTPWLKQWTLHTVEIPESDAEVVAEKSVMHLKKGITGMQTSRTIVSISLSSVVTYSKSIEQRKKNTTPQQRME